MIERHSQLHVTLLPLGDARFDFERREPWIARWGESSDAALPLIAVCPTAEQLAAFSREERKRGRAYLVAANGASLLRTSQHYHDISDSQRLVVFAGRDETEALEWLARTDCEFWELGAAELLAGVEGSVFRPLARWATNHEALSTIEVAECSDESLEQAASLLITAQRTANPEEDTPLARVIRRGWRLLNDAASWLDVPSSSATVSFLQRIDELRASIKRDSALIAAAVRETLNRFAECLAVSLDRSHGTACSKGDALLRCVETEIHAGKSAAIVACTESAVSTAKGIIRRIPAMSNIPVFSIHALPEDGNFDVLLVTSWPRGELLRRAVSKLVAPRIRLVGYAFERSWSKHAEARLLPRPVLPEISAERKTKIAFGQQTNLRWPERKPLVPAREPLAEDFDVWRWENALRRTRPPGAARSGSLTGETTTTARYVRFVGDCFAFMTEGHSLPVITRILSDPVSKGGKLPEKRVDEWRRGDFVVFPESGDREFVRQVADRLLGQRAQHLRDTARIWRDALNRSRLSPMEFHKKSRGLGWKRCYATARGYLTDDRKIGPELRDDLEIIAKATKDGPLNAALDDVWSAIQELWSAHQSAGSRVGDELRRELPSKLAELHETATRVAMGELGAAWVVMVEEIAPEPEPRARNEVNRLRWPEDEESSSLF